MRAERRAVDLRSARRRWAVALLVVLVVTGCSSGKKKLKPSNVATMSARVVYEHSMKEIQQGDLRQAQSLLGQINYTEADRDELEPLVRLAIADATFYESQGLNLIDARSLYLDFVALYGAHPLAPYAQMQAGVCSLMQVADPSRDQALTHQAVADLKITGQRWPDSSFAWASGAMVRRAEANLADHEFQIGRFYLKHKAAVAAVARFQRILDRYPHYREMEKVYYFLGEAQLKLGNDAEARIYLDKVVQEYPNGSFVKEARRELGKVREPQGKFDVAGSD